MKRSLLLAASAALALGACANLNTVHRVDPLLGGPDGRMVFIDAKQRAILHARAPVPVDQRADRAKPEYRQRFCSEPPPDAFSAYSMALSGDLAGNPFVQASDEAKARAAIAMSETAATIERTQTINLLRESMFRTCERFMGGAISEDEFIIQSARDQRAMVAVLAIEQLTGAVKAKSTVLSAGGSAATYADPSALYDALLNAQEDEADAKKQLEKAEAAPKQIKLLIDTTTTTGCDEIRKLTPPDPKAKPEDAKRHSDAIGQCDSAKAALEAATEEHARAKGRTQLFKSIADKHAFGLAASAGAGAEFDSGGGVFNRPSDSQVQYISYAVQNIVKTMNDFDEIEMTCVVRLRNWSEGSRSEEEKALDKACVSLVATKAETLKLINEAEREAALTRLRGEISKQSSPVEAYLSSGAGTLDERWAKILGVVVEDGNMAPVELERLRAMKTLPQMIAAFAQWDMDRRNLVYNALQRGALK